MELSLRALEEAQQSLSGAPPPTDGADPSSLQSAPSLMSFATKGAGRIPLHAVVQFVRLARSNSQKEVVEILADPVIQVTMVWNKIIVLYLSGQSVVYLPPVHFCKITVCTYTYMYVHVKYSKSRLAIRVLNYCRPRINAKRLNDVTLLALVRSSTT